MCSDRKQICKLHQCCFTLLGRNECQSYRVTDLTLALSKSNLLTPWGVGRRAEPSAGACSKAAHSQLTVRFLHTFQSVTDFVRVKLKFLTKQNLHDGMAWLWTLYFTGLCYLVNCQDAHTHAFVKMRIKWIQRLNGFWDIWWERVLCDSMGTVKIGHQLSSQFTHRVTESMLVKINAWAWRMYFENSI